MKRNTDQREHDSEHTGNNSTRTHSKFNVYFLRFLMQKRRFETFRVRSDNKVCLVRVSVRIDVFYIFYNVAPWWISR